MTPCERPLHNKPSVSFELNLTVEIGPQDSSPNGVQTSQHLQRGVAKAIAAAAANHGDVWPPAFEER